MEATKYIGHILWLQNGVKLGGSGAADTTAISRGTLFLCLTKFDKAWCLYQHSICYRIQKTSWNSNN